MDKSMNLHFNIYWREINTWQMTLLFFSFCHVLAPVVKCIRFVQLNEHYWYMNNLSDTCNIVGAWRRVFPSVRGRDWGDPTTTQKIGLSPHVSPQFFPKMLILYLSCSFWLFCANGPPTSRPHVRNPVTGNHNNQNYLNFSVDLFLLIESSLRLVSA